MEEILKILISNLTSSLGITNLSLALEQRFKNKKFRETILKELQRAKNDRERIIYLLEGVYIELQSKNDTSLIVQTYTEAEFTEIEKDKSITVSKTRKIILKDDSRVHKVDSADVFKNSLSTTTSFLFKYSKREHAFADENAITIAIPSYSEEYVQVSIIKTQIDINKQLYFQLENQTSGSSKYFETAELKEIEYHKPVHIICYKKLSELFLEVKMDGITLGRMNCTLH